MRKVKRYSHANVLIGNYFRWKQAIIKLFNKTTENLFFSYKSHIIISMKKLIFTSLLALSFLFPLTAKKKVELDYNSLAKTANAKDLKTAYKTERSLFYKVYYDTKETFLHLCLKNDRPYSIISMCIDYESDINAKTAEGKTPLIVAAEHSSDPKVIELLVKTDAMTKSRKRKRILQADNSGKNAFHYAKENPAEGIYSKLLEFIEDPNNYGDSDVPAEVQKEAPVDDIAAVQTELAKEAAELEALTYKEPVPPVESVAAVETPDPAVAPIAVAVVSPIGAEENSTKEEPSAAEETVAPEATENNEPVAPVATDLKKQEVETYASAFLLDYSEEPQTESKPAETVTIENPDTADKNGVTLLMKAAKSGNDWDVRTLLASGANVNLRDNDGWTALMYAVRYQNNLNIVNMLIEKGAYVRVRNKFNATPLLMAADYSKNPEILSLLLKNRTVSEDEVYRAFIFSITGKSSTDHVRAAKVKLFLDMKVPLNRLWKGQTPLMYAAQYGNSTEVIRQLLDAGANPSILNDKGMSAFDYAKNNKRLPHDESFWALNNAK